MLKKRFFMICTACAMIPSLTSCDVHFGSTHYDVPWWVIAIPTILIFITAHICFISHTLECPNCKTKFRPKWYEVSTWLHDESRSRRVAKCPHCHRKGFCRPADD